MERYSARGTAAADSGGSNPPPAFGNLRNRLRILRAALRSRRVSSRSASTSLSSWSDLSLSTTTFSSRERTSVSRLRFIFASSAASSRSAASSVRAVSTSRAAAETTRARGGGGARRARGLVPVVRSRFPFRSLLVLFWFVFWFVQKRRFRGTTSSPPTSSVGTESRVSAPAATAASASLASASCILSSSRRMLRSRMVAARPFFPPVAAISSSRRPKSTCSPTSRRMITFSRSFSVLMNAFWPLKRSARAEACFHFSRVAASSFCAASVALDASSTTSRHARSTSVSVRSESSVSSRTCALFSCASARSFLRALALHRQRQSSVLFAHLHDLRFPRVRRGTGPAGLETSAELRHLPVRIV